MLKLKAQRRPQYDGKDLPNVTLYNATGKVKIELQNEILIIWQHVLATLVKILT